MLYKIAIAIIKQSHGKYSINCENKTLIIYSKNVLKFNVSSPFIIAITSAIAGQYITVPAYQKYEVILDDSVSMNEFMNTYEVLEQRGQIYVVKEIEE